MKHRSLTVLAILTVILVTVRIASASSISYTLTTGGATTCAPGPGYPCALTSTDSTFSILRAVPDVIIPFSDYTGASYAYTCLSPTGCIGAGAPRTVVVTDIGQFIIQWGPPASFSDPTLGPGNTGNLLSLTDVGRYDLTGIGGSFYTDRTTALLTAGSAMVLRWSTIIDSFGGQDRSFVFGPGAISLEGRVPTAGPTVPEPASMVLLGSGLAGLVARRRRKATTV